ncbi:MAG: PAS domain S-box protein [Caldilineaceae bacterium]|nr:PAS domain S-box protein [Caldilineaceae bacterium]
MSVSPDSLVTEVELLRNRVVELEAQLLARADASGVIARLRERVKELSTLYRESYLADQTRSTPEDYFYEIVALLPPGWQYPEDCCARLLVNGQTYATPNFVESAWQQSCTVVVQGREIGMVTVAYLSAHPPADEGPFLAEERSLINEIAKRIGQFIERRQTETARRHLAAIVESTEDAILSESLDGIVQTWNAAAERIYGYTAREIVGKPVILLEPPSRSDELDRLLQRIRDGYTIEQLETRRRRKDGREIDIMLNMYPIRNDQGRIVGASTIARDISERRAVEASLRESDERVRYTFEQAAVGIAQVGLDGRFLRVNQKLCAIVGYGQDELLAHSVQDLIHPIDRANERALIEEMLAGARATYSQEVRYFHRDGHLVWVNLTVSLARDYTGQARSFIVVTEDISRRKKAEQALADSEARFRGLFENSPISLWEQDFSAVKAAIDRLRAEGVTDFRSYFEQHDEVVAACIAQVKLIDFNKASLALYGAESRDELVAGLDRLVPAEGYPLFTEELVWIAEGRTSFVWEGVNRKLSGERIHIRLHWSAAPGHETSLASVLVAIEDITAGRAAEDALHESELRYRMISELTSDFAFALRVLPDGTLQREWVTEAFARIFGTPTTEDEASIDWLEMVHPDDKQNAYAAAAEIIAGATSTVDLRVRTFSGATRWVRFTARPEYDATGKRVVRIHGAGKDISDVKALEAIALRNEGSQSPTGESGRGA